jgi:hypothetical protein
MLRQEQRTKTHEARDTRLKTTGSLRLTSRANNNNGDKMPSIVEQAYYRKYPENWKRRGWVNYVRNLKMTKMQKMVSKLLIVENLKDR